MTVPTLLTPQQLVERHPCFKLGGIKWWLFHRKENGLHTAVVRMGRRTFIDEQKFFAWLETQQNGESHR